ncbi:hypothetical protein DEM27_06455 [Metarhizobium album]|uniref:Uncharacterized protein n=1 Tax=Metarhizobium album TaxID=2182425 RepID=A0A2U2DVE3_9HYPH|nr:hypothetical protein [Rhizobium album]PWE57274.1 hypothetical protein DEM27_06455 [Rhizobium album]
MKIVFQWVVTLLFVAAAAAGLSHILLTVSGANAPPPCADLTELCMQRTDAAANRSLLIATVIEIALSAIGTLAVVATIFLSAQATKAAVAAADAANLAVALARETAARELRPYVTFDSWSLEYKLDANGGIESWLVKVTWKNTGISPATSVRAKATHDIREEELPTHFSFPDRVGDESAGSLGKDGTVSTCTEFIPVAEIQAILDGSTRLFVWSWVEYEGFEAERIYRSEWHSELHLWNGPATNQDLKGSNGLREQFNGSDEHCFRQPARKVKRLA